MQAKLLLVIILLLFLLSLILTPLVINYFNIDLLDEPVNKTYRSDELSFLKTFYLMEKGKGYYQAFKESRENLANPDNLGPDVFRWRMPASFYLWKIFANNGQQILTLFIFLSLTTLLAIFLILRKVIPSKIALIGPVILLPYLYDTLRYKSAFLFTEWWGLIFFIIGLASYLHKKNHLAIISFVLSIATREHFIIPLVFLLIVAFIRKENWKTLLTSLLIGLLIYFIHSLNVRSLAGPSKFNFFDRFHPYSLEDLQRMISFSMRSYVLFGLKSHYLVILLGVTGLLNNFFFKKSKEVIYLTGVVLSFLLILPLISVSDNDYWGIMFVPFIIMAIPLMFSLKIKHD